MYLPHSQDSSADRRNALLVFYIAALLSASTIGLAAKIPSFRTLLCALAIASAGVAVVFLLRFLRANDEREQQINYRALANIRMVVCLFVESVGKYGSHDGGKT